MSTVFGFVFVFVFGCTVQLARPQFPDLGLNLGHSEESTES